MSATETQAEKQVGQTRLRKEDARLVTGRTNWTDDINLTGALHMAIVRSPMAHARITGVDLSGALAMPGVVAAYSGADLAEDAGGLPCAWPVTPDMAAPEHKVLAVDEVAYVGDGVAVVLARTRAEAVDAAEHVLVDYDPLPAVVDMASALDDGADVANTSLESNRSYTWPLVSPDADTAARVFEEAEHTVVREFVQQRLIPLAMEPRSVVVSPMGHTGEYTIWSATQVPHFLRIFVSMLTGVPEHQVRVIAPDVGGGFGSKLNVYAEEVLAFVLAKRHGRPVKWTATRSEDIQATIHGRDQRQRVTLAMDADGTFRGLKVELLADMGAYLQLVTPGVPVLGAWMFPGIYKWDAYDIAITGVFTNKTPTDAYRGAGRPEATFAIERMVDEAARELGMDPLELRKKNWITHEEFPFDIHGGLTIDTGNYEAATAKAEELFDYAGRKAERDARRDTDDMKQLGIGISTYTEMCGLAPSRILGSLDYAGGGWESASVRILPTGKAEVITGTSPHGQGHLTAWSQIASDQLGIPFEDIEVRFNDTAIAHKGLDTYGSRSLVVGGYAVVRACEKVVDKATRLAAHLLEASEDDVEFSGGTFSVKGSPDASTTIQELAFAAFQSHDYPEGMELNLDSEATVDPENFSYPHGTHFALVEVDTETGKVELLDYVAVDDVGNVVNPQIVEGQVHGGLAQGIGQAMYEEATYDDAGNLTTGTLVDYYAPTAADLISFRTDRTETPATTNPLGVKGVGEAGAIASPPAIINAVVDALRPLGVDDVLMPCSPLNVWKAIQAAADDGGGGAGPSPGRSGDAPGRQHSERGGGA